MKVCWPCANLTNLAQITPTKEGHKKDLAMSQGCIKAQFGFRNVNIYIVLPIFTTKVQYSLNNLLEGDNIKIQCVLCFWKPYCLCIQKVQPTYLFQGGA